MEVYVDSLFAQQVQATHPRAAWNFSEGAAVCLNCRTTLTDALEIKRLVNPAWRACACD